MIKMKKRQFSKFIHYAVATGGYPDHAGNIPGTVLKVGRIGVTDFEPATIQKALSRRAANYRTQSRLDIPKRQQRDTNLPARDLIMVALAQTNSLQDAKAHENSMIRKYRTSALLNKIFNQNCPESAKMVTAMNATFNMPYIRVKRPRKVHLAA